MKTLRDYMTKGFECLADVYPAWSKILADNLQSISMDDQEYEWFTLVFMDKLPYDWNKESFMGIKIIRR